jgi:mannose-6-phosphate isomerase-like protein (cupin superfamily)
MIGLIQGKIWGNTQCLFNHNNVEIHRISAKEGGYCSVHIHSQKYNMFYVESGKLKVTIYRHEEPSPTDSIILEAGMSTIVCPNEKHMFQALEDTIAYEIYYVELETADIVRFKEGGFDEPKIRE